MESIFFKMEVENGKYSFYQKPLLLVEFTPFCESHSFKNNSFLWVDFVKFLRTLFLQNTSRRLLLNALIKGMQNTFRGCFWPFCLGDTIPFIGSLPFSFEWGPLIIRNHIALGGSYSFWWEDFVSRKKIFLCEWFYFDKPHF